MPTIKDKLRAQFPHYWIFISTVNKQDDTCDSSGEHYNFTTLAVLDSYPFPSATSETLHPGRQLQRGKGLHPVVSGRALALSTTTKSGGKFVIINLFQFTGANLVEKQEIWDIIAAWVLKYTNDQNNLIVISTVPQPMNELDTRSHLVTTYARRMPDSRTSVKTLEATSLPPDTTQGVGGSKAPLLTTQSRGATLSLNLRCTPSRRNTNGMIMGS